MLPWVLSSIHIQQLVWSFRGLQKIVQYNQQPNVTQHNGQHVITLSVQRELSDQKSQHDYQELQPCTVAKNFLFYIPANLPVE